MYAIPANSIVYLFAHEPLPGGVYCGKLVKADTDDIVLGRAYVCGVPSVVEAIKAALATPADWSAFVPTGDGSFVIPRAVVDRTIAFWPVAFEAKMLPPK